MCSTPRSGEIGSLKSKALTRSLRRLCLHKVDSKKGMEEALDRSLFLSKAFVRLWTRRGESSACISFHYVGPDMGRCCCGREWWVDETSDTIYMLPNTTSTAIETLARPTTIKVVAPKLQTLVSIRGAAEDPASGSDGSAANITLRGLTFSHSAPTYLEPYVVPSPGDWSVHR